MSAEPRAWWRWWWPPAAFMLAIFVVSSSARVPSLPGYTDKQLHGAAYGVLAILLVRAHTRGDIPAITVRHAATAWAVASLYGATDEVHQSFVPGRSADWLDLAADAAGAFAAVSALWACGIIARSVRAQSRHGR